MVKECGGSLMKLYLNFFIKRDIIVECRYKHGGFPWLAMFGVVVHTLVCLFFFLVFLLLILF